MTMPTQTIRVPSESDPSREYTLHVADADSITCNCRGYLTAKHCKHQAALSAALKKGNAEHMTTDAGTAVAHRDPDLPPQPIAAGPAPTALMTTKDELAQMWAVAQTVSKARGMIPANIQSPEQAMAVMLAGWELGLRPMTALRHVYIVNGKTEIETRAMVGIVHARDPRIAFSWPVYQADRVVCVVKRPGQPAVEVEYTVAMAKASGQLGEKVGPWQKYPRDMCYAAATKRACRIACPDLINAIDGAMVGVTDAESAVAQIDEPHADDVIDGESRTLPSDPSLYDVGDGPDAPLPPEAGPALGFDRKSALERITALVTRAKNEIGDKESYNNLRDGLKIAFPALISETGALKVSALSDDDAVKCGDHLATILDGIGPSADAAQHGGLI